MKAIVKISNNIQLEIEEKDELETLNKAIVLGNPKRRCDACGNTEGLYLQSNKGGGFFFVNYVCPKCGARSNLGQNEGGGYFWKTFEKWQPKEGDK